MKSRKLSALTSAAVGAFLSAIASAQSSDAGPGNPTLLQAVQALQSSLNGLQTTVNALNTKVNGVVANGVPPQPKLYYLTQGMTDGAGAPNACQAGFHMASFWEIVDPSTGVYESGAGLKVGDSGSGPPSGTFGWIRTGAPSRTLPAVPGLQNCGAYTSSDPSAFGTTVALIPVLWGSQSNGFSNQTPPWQANSGTCNTQNHVWCVQDQ